MIGEPGWAERKREVDGGFRKSRSRSRSSKARSINDQGPLTSKHRMIVIKEIINILVGVQRMTGSSASPACLRTECKIRVEYDD